MKNKSKKPRERQQRERAPDVLVIREDRRTPPAGALVGDWTSARERHLPPRGLR